jgi:hypothetical protein
MATIDELSAALVKADAAGNAADAKAFADAIRQMRAAPSSGIPAGRGGVNQIPGYGGPVPAAQPQQRGFLSTIGAPIEAVSQGIISAGGNIMFGGQQLVGKGIRAIGAQETGTALIEDAARRRAESQATVAPFKQEFPIATGAGELGGEILATMPVGGAIATPVKAVAKMAPSLAKFLVPLATSIQTSGFQTGLAPGIASVGTRALGGAITGGAAAALINPEDAATGAAIGALVPTLGQAAVKGAAKYVRKLADLKSATYLAAVEGKGDDIVNALTSKGAVITPGSAPTAAEVAATAGSTKFSAFGKSLAERPEVATEYAAAAAQSNQARLAQEARVMQGFADQAAKVKAQLNRGLVDVSPTEVGNALSAAAKAERQSIKKGVIEPAYKAAFDAAGDAKIDVSNVVQEAETILGRKLSDFATETAPDTVRKLRSFVPAVPEAEAATIGKAGFKAAKPVVAPAGPPEATLLQLDDVRKAINADIAAASASNAPMAATTLRNLRSLHTAIDDAIGKSAALTDDAKSAYAGAVNTYRTQYAPRFKEGVNADLFKRTSGAEGKIRPEDVVGKYFTPNGESEARQFTQLFGNNPDALVVARAGIEDLFRKKVVDAATGDVSQVKLANFMRDHGRAIDIFDQSGMNLRARFDAISSDAQRLAQIEATAKASGNKLSPPLPPGANALAIEQRISNLTSRLTPQQLTAVNAVRDDLAREAEFQSLAAAGRAGGKDIKGIATAMGKEAGVAPLPSILSLPITVYNAVVKKLLGVVDDKLALELAREMTNPAVAAQSIKNAMAKQAEQQTVNLLGQQVGARITPGLAQMPAQQNQNALAER